MPNVAHFAINANNIERACRFYQKVFGWKFSAWGPPGFFMIDMGPAAEPQLRGSLQQRRELVPGKAMVGFECTIAVSDVDATSAAVEANGGKVIMKRVTIAGVGHLIFFEDPEGNLAGAMQYDVNAQ